MKKVMLFVGAVCIALGFASCKSSQESAYQKAYKKAQAQNQEQTQQPVSPAESEIPIVAPVETPAATTQTQPQPVENYENVPVRHENVTYESGQNLKAFSVVIGSYSVHANAQDLLPRLQNAGYQAAIASATVNGTKFYRVISGTYDTKAEAAKSKNAILGGTFNPKSDAWILAR